MLRRGMGAWRRGVCSNGMGSLRVRLQVERRHLGHVRVELWSPRLADACEARERTWGRVYIASGAMLRACFASDSCGATARRGRSANQQPLINRSSTAHQPIGDHSSANRQSLINPSAIKHQPIRSRSSTNQESVINQSGVGNQPITCATAWRASLCSLKGRGDVAGRDSACAPQGCVDRSREERAGAAAGLCPQAYGSRDPRRPPLAARRARRWA
eukprot:6433106-Prymnesium_polylepis.1